METETKNKLPTQNETHSGGNKLSIPMAIVVAGILIAGAVYFSSTTPKKQETIGDGVPVTTLAPIKAGERTLGDKEAKVALVLYTDFQCPFCSAVSGFLPENSDLIKALKQRDPNWQPFMPEIINTYIKNGELLFVYRDWPFLGPESIRSAEAAQCAGDQNKFWEYHDYLYSHQKDENKGAFSDLNLKSFAQTLGLDTTTFEKCFEEGKYSQQVADSRKEGTTAGVNGTPKGYLLKDGKVIGTIDGAESFEAVKQKIDSALK